MGKQTDLFDNSGDYSEYFELFQKQTEYSSGILQKAQEIKSNIQGIYNNFGLSESDNKEYKTWVFDFDVDLKQVSEQTEPGALKLFTRQYTPKVKVYLYHEEKNTYITAITFKDETKFIHKHINELFVGENISQEYFFDVAQQYFLLDFLYNQIKDDKATKEFINKLQQQIETLINNGEAIKASDDLQTRIKKIHEDEKIFSLNCKLRGRNMPKNLNPNLHSVISHINTIWRNLCAQKTFCIIGNYKTYLNEDEFIKQLNDKKNGFISDTISDYFQNDLLLLNNMEFMTENPFTIKWEKHQILAPILIHKETTDKYSLKSIDEIMNVRDQIFLFQKIKEDGIFYKSELLIPIEKLTKENFEKIISISMKLLRSKEQK